MNRLLCRIGLHVFRLIEPPSFADPLWIYPRGSFRQCRRCGLIQEYSPVGLWLDCFGTATWRKKRGGA